MIQIFKVIASAGVLLSLIACGGENRPASMFETQAKEIDGDSNGPTWVDVEPILKKNCMSCHAGRAEYTNASALADQIADRVSRPDGDSQRMPMGGALTPSEIQTLVAWAEAGAPNVSIAKSDSPVVEQMQVLSDDMKPVKTGWALTESCSSCHGSTGKSSVDSIPNLAGQKATYLVNRLKFFKTEEGAKLSPIMSMQAASLSDEVIEEIATLYSSLKSNSDNKLESLSETDLALYEKGKVASATCVGCHKAPESVNDETPNLFGQKSAFFVDQIKAFADGSRTSPMMQSMVQMLKDPTTGELKMDEVEALSLYFEFFENPQ